MSILDNIIAQKRREVEALRLAGYYRAVAAMEPIAPAAPSLRQSLLRTPGGIIAEFKRRSPSRGLINPTADVEEVVAGYGRAGAAAVSVLTDTPYFGGAASDLLRARRAAAPLGLPLLRKEFVVAPEQVDEARRLGASALLLIAAVLTAAELRQLAAHAHAIGLETLVEVHAPEELERAAGCQPDMVGVNSRNLANMTTDVAHAMRLAEEAARRLPGTLLVAESGIQSLADVEALRGCGYAGFLIGERFMREADPAAALANFLNDRQP